MTRARPSRRRFAAIALATATVGLPAAALLPGSAAVLAGRDAHAADASRNDRLGPILSSVARTPLDAAPFFATKASGLLSTPIESRGTLSLAAGGRIVKHTRSPIDERVTITDAAVRIERAGEPATELRVADDPALGAYAQGLRAVLAGDPAPLREHFDVDVDGDVSAWVLTLVPRSLKLQAAVRRIVVSGSNGLIRQIETTDGAGDVETLSVLLTPPAAAPR